jgi:hypothetical protein
MDDTPARKTDQRWTTLRLKDDGGRLADDGRNRDEVWEAERPANYKSVISALFGSDFSLKTASAFERLQHRNTILYANAVARKAAMMPPIKANFTV